MSPQFADVAPWPADSDRNIAGPKHNEPPIEERIVMDFAEKLVADGIASRRSRAGLHVGRDRWQIWRPDQDGWRRGKARR
jgi:hypothetical protein